MSNSIQKMSTPKEVWEEYPSNNHAVPNLPGAVPVAGPEGQRIQTHRYRSAPTAPNNNTHVQAVDAEEDAEINSAEISHPVQAYTVDEEYERHRMRNELMGEMRTSSRLLVGSILCCAIMALTIGLSLGLSSEDDAVNDNILVSVAARSERSGATGPYLGIVSAQVERDDLFEGNTHTSGFYSQLNCHVLLCLRDPGICRRSAVYFPGCCASANCTAAETVCGAVCPDSACRLKDPSNEECTSTDCYTCEQDEDGQDLYQLTTHVEEIDCVHAGKAIRPENGQEYKWAIICGAVVQGATPQANMGYGEYSCTALRSGAGFSHQRGGLGSFRLPCREISSFECGCAQNNTDTTDSCVPGGDCPFLCDPGRENVHDLCRAFPGDIVWWEGQNKLRDNFFVGADEEFEEYTVTVEIVINE